MQITSQRQAAILSRLLRFAGWNYELVQSAIRASSKDGAPASFRDVAQAIVTLGMKR